AGIKAKTYLFRGEKSMKWSWPDSPGGAALAPAYRFCMARKRSATPQKTVSYKQIRAQQTPD
ncbi:hypothetical protein ACVGWQ_13325, partial [Enterobacter hormaechei]